MSRLALPLLSVVLAVTALAEVTPLKLKGKLPKGLTEIASRLDHLPAFCFGRNRRCQLAKAWKIENNYSQWVGEFHCDPQESDEPPTVILAIGAKSPSPPQLVDLSRVAGRSILKTVKRTGPSSLQFVVASLLYENESDPNNLESGKEVLTWEQDRLLGHSDYELSSGLTSTLPNSVQSLLLVSRLPEETNDEYANKILLAAAPAQEWMRAPGSLQKLTGDESCGLLRIASILTSLENRPAKELLSQLIKRKSGAELDRLLLQAKSYEISESKSPSIKEVFIPPLIRLVKEKNPRYLAMDTLASLEPGSLAKDLVPQVIEQMNSETMDGKEEAAARLLGAIGDEKALPALITKVKTAEGATLQAVLEALGKFGTKTTSALPVLKSRLTTEKEPFVREELTKAIDQIAGKNGNPKP